MPFDPSISIGTSVQLKATATLSNNATKDVTDQVSWSTSDSDIASITSTGVVTGMESGECDVSALDGLVSSATDITVAF
jgi:hypothetical protein